MREARHAEAALPSCAAEKFLYDLYDANSGLAVWDVFDGKR